MEKIAVVALGGNALLRENEEGTIEQQEENATETVENLVHLIKDGYELVITHGNGPQVGNILMRNDAGEKLYNIAPMPLDICVADSTLHPCRWTFVWPTHREESVTWWNECCEMCY